MKAKKIEKKLNQIITQGNHDQIQELFRLIVKAHFDEFTEDNNSTIFDFIMRNVLKAYKSECMGNFDGDYYKAILDELFDEVKD